MSAVVDVAKDGRVDPMHVMDVREVAKLLHTSRSRIFELLNEDKFPRPFRIGRKNVWREAAIVAYLNRQERRAKVG